MRCKTLTILSIAVALQACAHAEPLAYLANPIETTCCEGDPIVPTSCSSQIGSCLASSRCGDTKFELSGGFLYMAREHNRNSHLITSVNTGEALVGMSDLDGDYESGFELRGRWSNLEVRYMQITGDNRTLTPATVGSQITYMGDDYFSDLVVDYRTELNSVEVNLLGSNPCDRIRLSGGFRYLSLDESIAGSFPGFTGVLYTNTQNDLYGLQLGADADLWTSCDGCCTLVCNSKAGVYYSDNNLQAYPNASGGATLGSAADSSAAGAFVGELGLLLRVQATRRLTFDAGYNLMYITGVALAGDQIQNTDMQPSLTATTFIDTGDLLYHGLMTRATFSY